ncbi:MAG: lytic transglycosylase domain-containing protein [Actinomycetota bacterium]|nr:lytic transglycosylase domain-containing protein [Actinomycetota bacterium]
MRRLAPALVFLALAAGCSPGSDNPTVASGTPSTTAESVPSTTTIAAPPETAAPVTPAPSASTTRPRSSGAAAGVATLPEGSPTTVLEALATAEPAIRDPATSAGDLQRHGESQQVAYRQLAIHPEWLPQVLDRLPEGLRGIVRANTEAGIELRALTRPQTALPPWRIVAPAPAEELLGYYKAAEAEVGAPWNYLAAIHLVETRMGRIRGTSTAGAQGPMQFLPSTWAQYGKGGDINSNRDAMLAAARLLVRNGAPGDMANALFNYNRSQRYVKAVTAYAQQMAANERAYFGYYQWQVYYRLVDGDRLLPVGYGT